METIKVRLHKIIDLLFGLFCGSLIIAPHTVLMTIYELASTYDFLVLRFGSIFAAVYYRRALFKIGCRLIRRYQKIEATKKGHPTIDGVPVIELVDYLVRNRHFRREGINGVRQTFGLNMEKFNRLAASLERNGVLVRGENNGRVLASKWTRQLLFDYLSGNKKSKDLFPHFAIKKIGGKVRLDSSSIIS